MAPPAAAHSDDEEDPKVNLCKKCHLAYSTYWMDMVKVELTCQPRFSADSEWAEFLNIIRKGRPTQQQIDRYMQQVPSITAAQARALVSNNVKAICSHRKDVATYNEHALGNAFSSDQLVTVPLRHNVKDSQMTPDLRKWLDDSKFHGIRNVAIGAPVALNTNIDVSKGATNGTTGVVHALEFVVPRVVDEADDAESEQRYTWWGVARGYERVVINDVSKIPPGADLHAIHIKIDGADDQDPLRVERTHFKRKYGTVSCRDTFIKNTFPLVLGYSLTGHRCQGVSYMH